MSPFSHLSLSLSLLLSTSSTLLFFSLLGFGSTIYSLLSSVSVWFAYVLLGSAILLLLLLYLFDAQHSSPSQRYLGYYPLLATASACLVAFCLLATRHYPYAPLLCSFMLPVCAVWATRALLLHRVRPAAFFGALSFWLLVLAALIAATFALWVFAWPGWQTEEWRAEFGGNGSRVINMWAGHVKQYWRTKNGCKDGRTPMPMLDANAANDCYTGAFLWWSFPLWIMFVALVYASVFYFLARAAHEAKTGARSGRVQFAFRLFIAMIVFFMGLTWCAASVAGAGLGIARTVELAILLFVVVTTIVVGKTVGWATVTASARSTPFYKKLSTYSDSFWDYLKAFALWGLGWLALAIYFGLAAANQACRKCLPCTLEPDSDGALPLAAQGYLVRLRRWNWGSILSKTTVWSIAYLVLQVIVMQVVVVFFAWLNEVLAPLQTWQVCLIFSAVGLTMFMIPVIPGVPVYIACGAVVPSSMMGVGTAHDELAAMQPGDPPPLSFWYGMLLASAVGFALKLLAVALEQEVIGRAFGGYVSVRALVRVNSVEMRASRMILQRRGLNFAKCAILVGGPDWPTSVITGILRLNVFQMLLGTTPILPLIVASTAAGAFQLLTTKSDTFSSVALIITFLSMLFQLSTTIAMLAVIARHASLHREELAAMPPDVEVLAYDARAAAYTAALRAATHWSQPEVRLWPKLVITASAIMLAVACYMSILVSCFVPFSVSESISNLPGGNPLGVVRTPGWIVIGLFLVGWALRYVYRRWAHVRAKDWIASGRTTAARIEAGTAHIEAGSAGTGASEIVVEDVQE